MNLRDLRPPTTHSAYVPGTANLVTKAGEWFNAPRIAMILAAALLYREMRRPKGVLDQETRMACDEKYCPPKAYVTHVDRPLNTLLKDQSQGAGLSLPRAKATLEAAYRKTKSDYYEEALASPGVKLVAHTVA